MDSLVEAPVPKVQKRAGHRIRDGFGARRRQAEGPQGLEFGKVFTPYNHPEGAQIQLSRDLRCEAVVLGDCVLKTFVLHLEATQGMPPGP